MDWLKEKWCSLGLWLVFVLISQKIHLSFSFAEHHISFACFSLILPLIGFFAPLRIAGPLGLGMWFFVHLGSHIPFTMGIPTLLATYSWHVSKNPKSVGNSLVHLFLPLLCTFLFYISSVGKSAWPYTLYWCIPLVLYFLAFNQKALLVQRALMSTFVAHAVGSVIWVYWMPMTSEQWLSLIPVVAIERLTMAAVAVGICLVLKLPELQRRFKPAI